MSALTSFTSTSFGYLIAYFPAGLVALLGMSYWVRSLHTVFAHFETSTADVGLFLLVSLLALTVTLILLLPRWLLFEEWLLGSEKPPPVTFSKLSEEGKATAYLMAVEQHYRYHQFYGGMLFGSLFLFVGWASHTSMGSIQRTGAIIGFVIIELLLFLAARDSLSKYYDRGREIMS
jgi:hypothetical protein